MAKSKQTSNAASQKPSLTDEHLRISQLMSGLTMSWPVFRIKKTVLVEIESASQAGDQFLQSCERDMKRFFRTIIRPEDHVPIAQAYAVYAEASIYLLFKDKGIQLERTPGTGGKGQKRPDFLHKHASGDVYFEVKCLDFQDGLTRHNSLAYDALEAAVDLDTRAQTQGVHTGVLEISSFDVSATPADRIETLISKIEGNAKMGQLCFGPCVLIVDLGRLEPDAQHPSCILPIYYNESLPSETCASGELWHVALGRIDDMIYKLPEFEGKPNLDRPLKKVGILHQYPELLGITFVIPQLSNTTEIYSIWNISPETAALANPLTLIEHEVGDLFVSFSDALNNDKNTYGSDFVRRPTVPDLTG